MTKFSLIFVIIIVCLTVPVSCLAFDSCSRAYDNGKDTETFVRCQTDAEAGKADAQFGYALILFAGHDRENDQKLALEWFRKSARQGHLLAQVALGTFLSRNEGKPELRNQPEAYAWYRAAGEVEAADRLWAELTAREAEEAEKLATEYVAKYRTSHR